MLSGLPHGLSSSSSSSTPGGSRVGVRDGIGSGGGVAKSAPKKRYWTPTEDAILVEYVKNHGEGKWSAVQENTGLSRCRKSCRHRWINHLRPNLRKESFTPEEEILIIQLHSQLGNKWARMAGHLPPRTANDIKNYWNTTIKRRTRQGLPLYPWNEAPHSQGQGQEAPPLPLSGVSFQFSHQQLLQSSPLYSTPPDLPSNQIYTEQKHVKVESHNPMPNPSLPPLDFSSWPTPFEDSLWLNIEELAVLLQDELTILWTNLPNIPAP
ncbi:hypothetical protein SAY87_015733 [Trapa incisa]|uniref:Uncharacterized protein n=1 Tax=Trapa incisa TaxID=236973 RepID=A0AAN7QUV6_9MYRT|nr:hypothetical protein SAY87_015733 [Trapa incisa]